jgi:glycosyltransferase involved in cell wall biosynthesis
MTLDLSVAMLVRNPPIDRLATLADYMSAIASEFVIVDTGSSREEIEAMASWNKAPFGLPKVSILRREWRDDFSWARNEGLDAVTRKWTLILDPDEIPSTAMVQHISRVVRGELDSGSVLGWLYFTRNYTAGKLDPEYEFHWHVRLFQTGRGRFYRSLDELVALDGLYEPETRGTPVLPKAPRNAYLIHSKSSDDARKSAAVYERMRQDGKV